MQLFLMAALICNPPFPKRSEKYIDINSTASIAKSYSVTEIGKMVLPEHIKWRQGKWRIFLDLPTEYHLIRRKLPANQSP